VTDAKFTLIVPSYNGGGYLKQCLASLRAQTEKRFEIAILDDGSTDGSLEWLRGLNEPCLTIYPAPKHLGIVKNWQRALEIPKAEFMTIIGQDDLLDPNYLAVMDTLIQTHPDAGLYHAHFRFINAQGNTTRRCRPLPERESAAGYLQALFTGQRDTYGTGYLMRSEHYESVGGIPEFEKLLFADDALWMALMLRGGKASASEECFSCRLHAQSTSGGPPWQSWLQAMPPYAAFLAGLAGRNPEFAQAFSADAPAYFEQWRRNIYTLALTQATRRGERVAPDALGNIAHVAGRMPPGLTLPPGRAFAEGRGLKARELINRFAAARTAYCAYVRLRYGSR
jgi:hypothetical protein